MYINIMAASFPCFSKEPLGLCRVLKCLMFSLVIFKLSMLCLCRAKLIQLCVFSMQTQLPTCWTSMDHSVLDSSESLVCFIGEIMSR